MAIIEGTTSNRDDVIVADGGNDVINSGNGNDTVDGGGGSDTIRAGAGDDTLIYVLSDNLSANGTHDLYVGGAGIDTVRLVLTEAQYRAAFSQIQNYEAHLATVKRNNQHEVSNASASDFTFTFEAMVDGQPQTATLTVSMMEVLEIIRLPDAQDVTASGEEDTPIILVQLAGTDDDGLGTIVSYTLTSLPDPDVGTLFIDGGVDTPAELGQAYPFATFYFVPSENFKGEVKFTYTVTDADGNTDPTPATVTINVEAVDDQATLSGTAVDGYIVGATVFADADGDGKLSFFDANNNGIKDAGENYTEAWTTTGANGQFTLVGGSGPIVLIGGTDISTGTAFEGVLKAPAGSTVVSPLTTLIAALIPANTAPEDLSAAIALAESQVLDTFNIVLGAGQSLTTLDPVAAALAAPPGDTTAASVYAAGIQVQNLIVLAAAASGSDLTNTAAATFGALAAAITAVQPINLAAPSTALLESIVGSTDVTALQLVVTAVNTAVNTAVSDPDANSLEVLTQITQTAVVAQSASAAQAANGTGTSQFVGNIESTVAGAQVGVVGAADIGTAGNDSIIGTDGNDAIDGLGGQDTLRGGLGADYLFGGNGNDRLFGDAGNDQLFGGAGNDTLVGGAGADLLDGGENPSGQLVDSDWVDYSEEGGSNGVTVNLALGTATDSFGNTDTLLNIEAVRGTAHNDVLTGGDQSNVGTGRSESFEGMAGNDTITGGIDNNFVVYTSSPNGVTVNLATGTASDGWGDTDTLSGINRVRGSMHNDVLIGSDTGSVGNERFEGMAGNDTIYGGGGVDYVMYGLSPSAVSVNLATGTANDGWGTTDTFHDIMGVRGSNFDDMLVGSNNPAGTVDRFEGMAGNDTISGGGGQDRVEYGQSPTGVTVNLATGTASDGFGGTDTLISIEQATGSRFNDVLLGDAQNNRLEGGLGNDSLRGEAGNDLLIGGDGDDTLIGGDGNDTLLGGNGNDVLNPGGNNGGPFGTEIVDGGPGIDTLNRSAASAGVNVNLADGAEGNRQLISIENVIGSAFNDTIIGDANANHLQGGAGNDVLRGGAGADVLDGGTMPGVLPGSTGDNDVADYLYAGSAVHVNMSSQAYIGSGITAGVTIAAQTAVVTGDATDVDTLLNIEVMRGSIHNDILVGGEIWNRFEGRGGDDIFIGNTQAARNEVSYQYLASGNYVRVNIGADFDASALGLGLGTLTGGTAVSSTDGTDVFINIDSIRTGSGDDVLIGNDGNNRLNGGIGADYLNGRGGTDEADYLITTTHGGVIVNLSNSQIIADVGNGNQVVTGGQAQDYYANGTASFDTLVSIENLRGSDFGDYLVGSDEANRIRGEGGNDWISGGAGNDLLEGGAGNDTLIGGEGNDSLYGGDGDDVLSPGPNDGGPEHIDGGAGIDTYDRSGVTTPGQTITGQNINLQAGTNGASRILVNIENVIGSMFDDLITGDDNANRLEGGAGNDTLIGGDGNDTLLGGDGIDSLLGGAGNDWLNPGSLGGPGIELIDGGDGIDTLDRATATMAQDINLALGTNGSRTVLNVENAIGGIYNDTITGSDLNNWLVGNAGNDWISGGAGNDLLEGGAGNDTLIGGEGNDSLYGGDGDDVLSPGPNDGTAGAEYIDGGAGIDTYDRSGVTTPGQTITGQNINLQAGTNGSTRILVNIENVIGSNFDDLITGDGNANRLEGRDGNDTLLGGAGNDTLIGGEGNDTLLGGEGNDLLRGGAGADFLDGGTTPGVIPGNTGDNDVADYLYAGSPVHVNMSSQAYTGSGITAGVTIAAQTAVVTGDATDVDTLLNIEVMRGSNHNDILVGGEIWNRFEGRSGDDIFIGNTQAARNELFYSYLTSSSSYVRVNIGADFDASALGLGTLIGGTAVSSTDGTDVFINIDSIRTGSGDDVLIGNDGNNRLNGGIGADYLNGRGGTDEADYRSTTHGGVIVNLSNSQINADVGNGNQVVTGGQAQDYYADGTLSFDTLVSIEDLRGSDFGDYLVGSDEANRIRGEGGNDWISGGAGNDLLEGGAGNDTLQGGMGNDILVGGEGAEVFKWNAGDQGTDTIADFDSSTSFGTDALDLRGLLVGESLGTLDNYLDFDHSGANTVINIKPTGAGAVEQQIVLQGVNLGSMGTDQDIITAFFAAGKIIID